MAKKTPKTKTIAAPAFTITLKLGEQTYTGTGPTPLDALMAVPKPVKMMGKAILTITNGTLKKEMQYFPVRLKRLFYNKNFQAIQAKQLMLLMK